MEGAEILGRSRNIWREQKYREEVGIHGLFLLLHGISAPSMYSYFLQVFLVNACIPTSSRYFCSLHVFLLLPGISAPSMYSYFFPVFLLPPCIPTFSRYFWLIHVFLLLPGIPG
jgi:hypothetical protein